MSKPFILSLSRTATLAVFSDFELMQRWELLRRSPAEATPKQFAGMTGTTLVEAQHSLDRLLNGGLVVQLRASGARRSVAYRAVASEVLLSWNPAEPEQLKVVRDFYLACRGLSRVILDRQLSLDGAGQAARPHFFGFASVMLTPEEFDKVNRLLRAACEVIDEADTRAEARARGTYAGDMSAEREFPCHLAVECRQLSRPELPLPHFELWDERSVPREIARVERRVDIVLTQRELEIARLLAAGKSRPAIAKTLHITPNTVATFCKRIHAKLGVHSRAELTARLSGVGPAAAREARPVPREGSMRA